MPRAAAPSTTPDGTPHARSGRGSSAAIAPIGVVVPIRSFNDAKARLAGRLDTAARAAVMRSMAERVLAAAAPSTVIVVTGAPEVREWALALGADVVDDPGSLDGSATAGVAHLAQLGFERAVVVHADLPRARSLSAFARDGARPIVALTPCHRDDGTNVLALPTGVPFRFAYGEGSFLRHLAEARRLHLGTRVVRDPDLALDVDELADLNLL